MIALSFNNKCMSFNDKLMCYGADIQSATYWTLPDATVAGNRESVTQTIDTAVTSFNYFTLKFQHQASHPAYAWADDVNINFNTGAWNMRAHMWATNAKPVRNGSTFTAANSDVYDMNIDNQLLRFYIGIEDTTNATYKFVVDRNAAMCSAFIDDIYLGYGTVDANITAVDNIYLANEQLGGLTAQQYALAGFNNLAAAVAY